MDPFSITTGCIGLVASIQSLIAMLGPFFIRMRSARKDIEAVQREVSALHICILSLKAEPPDSRYPASLRRTLNDVIKQCNIIIDEMVTCLSDQDRAKWALAGQSKINVLRSRLEAHKATIDIALEMMSLPILARVDDTATNIHAQTTEIKQDTEEIHQQTTQLLAEIKALKTQIAEMEGAQPAQSQNQNNGHAYILQRFLDQSSTYAESIADHRNSVSNLEVISECPLSDEECVVNADDDDELIEKAADEEQHDNASDGGVDEEDDVADNEKNFREGGKDEIEHTETNGRKQDDSSENEASEGAETFVYEANTLDSADKRLNKKIGSVQDEIERREEAEIGEAEGGKDAEPNEDQDVETATNRGENRKSEDKGETREQGNNNWKEYPPETADKGDGTDTDDTYVERPHETAQSITSSCSETRGSTADQDQDQDQELSERQSSLSRTKQEGGYQRLTLSWTPVAEEERDDLSRSFGDLLHRLRNVAYRRDMPQLHLEQFGGEPIASVTLTSSESVKVPEACSSSTAEELRQEQKNESEIDSIEQNIEGLQLQIKSLMHYKATGMEEVLRALELDLWQAERERQQLQALDKEQLAKHQDLESEVEDKNKEGQDRERDGQDDLIQPVQLKATLDSPEWDAFHIYNTPATTDEVQTRYRFQDRKAYNGRFEPAKQYEWSLDTEKEVVSDHQHKKLPVIPTSRFANGQKRLTAGRRLRTESGYEKELVVDADVSPSLDSAEFDTEKELAIYFEKELAADAGETSKLEELENHKIHLDEAIDQLTSASSSFEGDSKALERTGECHSNEPLDRLRRLRDTAVIMITALRNETSAARDRSSRLVKRNTQGTSNNAVNSCYTTVGKQSRKPAVCARSQTTQAASSSLQSKVMPRLFPRNHRRTVSEADSSHADQPNTAAREAQPTHSPQLKYIARDAQPTRVDMSELIAFLRGPKLAARGAQMTRGAVPDLLEFLRDTQTARPEARSARVAGAGVSHLADCIRHTEPRVAAAAPAPATAATRLQTQSVSHTV